MPKVCAACQTENPDDRQYCKKCFAELPASSGAQPQPSAAPQAPLTANPSLSTPPARKYTEKTYLADPEPVEKPPSAVPWGWIIVLLLIVGGGLAYKFAASIPHPEPKVKADAVVMSFLDAKQAQDYRKARLCLSEESIKSIEMKFSDKQSQSAGLGQQDAQDMNLWGVEPTSRVLKDSSYVAVRRDDPGQASGTATVRASLTPKVVRGLDVAGVDCYFVLVQEGDQWKVDLKKSAKRTEKHRKLAPGLD